MPQFSFRKKTKIVGPSEQELYDWHIRPGALERLTPSWERIKILNKGEGVKDGSEVEIKSFFGPIGTRWHLLHTNCTDGKAFSDYQIKGPFKYWCHKHIMEHNGETAIEDAIDYDLPLGKWAEPALDWYVKRKLKRLFNFRHEVVKYDLEFKAQLTNFEPKKILIVGGTGLIGRELKNYLSTQGHEVSILSRSKEAGTLFWDPTKKEIDPKALTGMDVVINLSGCPIDKRWSTQQKIDMYESRVRSTQFLAKKIAAMKQKPAVLINASAIGVYGVRRAARLHEESQTGEGFLSELAHAWEAATAPVSEAGVRVVNLRIGVVLTPKGGMLKKLLPVYKCGLGGRLGSGMQTMSWIALDDLLDSIHFCIFKESLSGPINAVSPYPVTNFKFKQALAEALRRKAPVPIPEWILKLLFGEMGEETILSSLRVKPQRLMAAGFKFRYPRLEKAFKHMLK